jgi:thiamine pyrophosphokinase
MCHFKAENSSTYFMHKITRNEKTVKRNEKTKHSVISKLYNLNTLKVLGLKYSTKCERNV